MANGDEASSRNGVAVKIFAGVMTTLIALAVVASVATNRSLAVLAKGSETQSQQIASLTQKFDRIEERLRLTELELARRGQR